jgi:hypothetical protein
MPGSLPDRPDLGQLRRQAKELRDAARRGDASACGRFTRHHPSAREGAVSLAAAQLVIARELGFSSWPRLKAAIDADALSRRGVRAFVAASVEGRVRKAGDILRADPGIAGHSLLAATVLGDADAVREKLAMDPEAAVAIDEERGWPRPCWTRATHAGIRSTPAERPGWQRWFASCSRPEPARTPTTGAPPLRLRAEGLGGGPSES